MASRCILWRQGHKMFLDLERLNVRYSTLQVNEVQPSIAWGYK
ncbi:hypothetical protein [Nostoc sp. 'Peltigera membranacea cyanobiont' 210A]|nr:hypothetical protein [Nostoc sp. 'Peltigera membranacea cyanobiont' 210A]